MVLYIVGLLASMFHVHLEKNMRIQVTLASPLALTLPIFNSEATLLRAGLNSDCLGRCSEG